MAGLYFEEFSVGQMFDHALRRTITEADNVWFSALTHNPAPLHLDAEYCKSTEFGKPLVNSCLTLGVHGGHIRWGYDGRHDRGESRLGRCPFPEAAVSRRYHSRADRGVELRESKSRPQNGIVIFEHRAYNQDDELVGICKRSALMHRKPA